MPEAARQTDQISHTSALAGLLAGLAIGAVAAVAIAATVATGGVAGVLIGAGIGLAGTAGGGLAGEYIGAAIPSLPSGVIVTGSPNVFTGGLPAARAVLDFGACSGLPPLMPHGQPPIAQGSTTVFINSEMAARVGDLLICSAKISTGCPTVIIGGPAGTAPGMEIEPEVPAAVNGFLFGAMVAGMVIGTGGAALAFGIPVALAALAGGILGGAVGGWGGGEIGEAIGSLFGAPELGKRIGEVAGGVIGSMLGGGIGGRWSAPETPPEASEIGEGPQGRPTLPADPNDLLQHGYVETSDPRAASAGRRTFENPATGDRLDFDQGKSGRPGFAGQDHYHQTNSNASGRMDQYLDKNGNPVPRGSRASHLLPGD